MGARGGGKSVAWIILAVTERERKGKGKEVEEEEFRASYTHDLGHRQHPVTRS